MLTGDLVRLRPIEPDDADVLWRWHNDPEVVRWLDFASPESLAQIRQRMRDRPRNGYDKVTFMVETLDSGRTIGVIALRDAEPEHGRAELDVYLGEKDCWGRGYGTDAATAGGTACS
ncbi:GNAT family N-acetyltransferase [Streptomyces sp. 6N223]|uniref:GNAT family N-acetyltransferase n=1 Tax=Streptomyces sp. 6N223 TaxID=3457412 RepID=UPI003FD10FFC